MTDKGYERASFAPIAIVGRGCVLPGALTPDALWDAVVSGRDLLSSPPEGAWRIAPDRITAADAGGAAWSDRGGYVTGFDAVFDPAGFAIPPDAVCAVDPFVQWALHAARDALREAGHHTVTRIERAGIILGNLSLPSRSLSRFAESVWLDGQGARFVEGRAREIAIGVAPDPRNRFMSGLPAHILAEALGLGACAFALDAACASSLYAIKLACDALHDGRADMMLAGAVSGTDPLFLYTGFRALRALSPSGRSRPFHRAADGLVTAEGAGFVALKRLTDAERAGDTIFGVIRQVGLSNDGGRTGLLVPSEEGQVRAMRRAYDAAGLSPADISLVECHATGTPLGDATEIRSMSVLYHGRRDVPIGSLKSNLGHLLTAAGVAGLIKVLGALRAGGRPPTLHADEPLDALHGSPFRLLTRPEPWEVDGPRRAAVSAFGLGGNNAHLLVEEWDGGRAAPLFSVAAPPGDEVAIVAIGVVAARADGAAHFARALFSCTPQLTERGGELVGVVEAIELGQGGAGRRFPPRDLAQALPQQLLLLRAAQEALAEARPAPPECTGVLIGMQCDAEIARYSARYRVQEWGSDWANATGRLLDDDWIPAAQQALSSPVTSAVVVGALPNIIANRLNAAYNLAGPSYTTSAEELSGIVALQAAVRALRTGELDAALVGAVDLCCEPVHEAARAVLGADRQVPGDAAVVLVLKRLADARVAGDRVYAVLPAEPHEATELRLGHGEGTLDLTPLFGHAHAASGLLHVAAAALACAYRLVPGSEGREPTPWVKASACSASIVVQALGGQVARVDMTADSAADAMLFVMEPAPDGVPGDEPALWNQRAVHVLAGAERAHAEQTGTSGAYPAHLSAVRLPALGSDGPQIMAPAPALPPISDEWEPIAAPTDAARKGAEIDVPARVVRREQATAAPVAARALYPAAAGARPRVDHLKRLSEVHIDHLTRVSQAHRQFLQTQTAGWQAVTRAVRASTAWPPLAVPALAEQGQRVNMPHGSGNEHVSAGNGHPGDASDGSPGEGGWASPGSHAEPPVEVVGDGAAGAAISAAPTAEQPRLTRADLEALSTGTISAVLGPLFRRQDSFRRQVRLPEPPLLLVDRVISIDGEPGSMGVGRICTETDVRLDSWYLHDGYMLASIQVEAGQADLLLISWLGVDFLNQGERIYRLLGCELSFHGERPRPGQVLRYEIHIDRHARAGDVRLFFFHYDCYLDGKLSLRVRNGQAGFFTDGELRDSGGVVWDPLTAETSPYRPPAPPVVVSERRAFGPEQMRAFAEGRAYECFGRGFEAAMAHVHSPRIPAGPMLLIDRVTHVEPSGGPWGRGYLRAERDVAVDDWFFPCHFKDDPTMPGTLMMEGCAQAMCFYLAALGFTLARDGWRFEPVPDAAYTMVCRGQVTPSSRKLVYEVFVEQLAGGPQPMLYADVLLSVDGLKAFHCRGFGLRLVPDWPLTTRLNLLDGHADPALIATIGGHPLGYRAMLACAWGRPSEAFTEQFRVFDGHRHVPRLPGPPYLFMSRITRVEGEFGVVKAGARVECAYDVTPDVWYFAAHSGPTMPFCVLLEAALQPCGWLTAYVGIPLSTETDLYFRNLGGIVTVHGEIPPAFATVRTVAELTDVSPYGDTVIESFKVCCYLGETPVLTMATSFGHFTRAALAAQVGLPADEAERDAAEQRSDVEIDLTTEPERYFGGAARLACGMLRLLDRITGYWLHGGTAGLGRMRAEMAVDPAAWFFKAHFFRDPVQPGSLGIEAMLQLLRLYMLHTGMADGMVEPRFETPALDRAWTIKFRGQVVPANRRVLIELEVTETGQDARGIYAVAEAWLWVDGKRIYHVRNLAARLVHTGAACVEPAVSVLSAGPAQDELAALTQDDPALPAEEWLDPAVDTWLRDHCPTYTLPALPMMFMVDRLALAAQARLPKWQVVGVSNVQVHRWLICDRPRRLLTEVAPVAGVVGAFDVALLAWRDATTPALARFEPVARGRVVLAPRYASAPAPLPPLPDTRGADDPYRSDDLFHGPAFHVLKSLAYGAAGSSAILDAAASEVPRGLLNQLLLDGITHAIPNADLHRWSPAIAADQVSYPVRLLDGAFHGPTPARGEVRCEVRFDGFHEPEGGDHAPRFRAQLLVDEAVWADLRVVSSLFPKGPIGGEARPRRRAFLRDRTYVPGMGLSRLDGAETRLSVAEVKASDWLPGTIATAYGAAGNLSAVTRDIAVKDHIAHRVGVHPAAVTVTPQGVASCARTPFTGYPVEVSEYGNEVCVADAGPPALDVTAGREYWRRRLGRSHWPVEDIYFAMAQKFVRRWIVEDPDALARLRRRSVLYLANHQVALESFLFTLLMPGLMDAPLITLAKSEVRTRWLAEFMDLTQSYPDITLPDFMVYLNQHDPASMLRTFAWCAEQMEREGLSALVHVEGTRSMTCRRPVETLSSALVDMALEADAPIVPVRFVGGLPVEPLERRLHVPFGHGSQDTYIGRPIMPDELRLLPYAARRQFVLAAMNALGPGWRDETPNPPDPAFEAAATSWMTATGASEEYAILLQALERMADPGKEIQRLLDGARSGRLTLPDTPLGAWLAQLAVRVFGERGPTVVVGAPTAP